MASFMIVGGPGFRKFMMAMLEGDQHQVVFLLKPKDAAPRSKPLERLCRNLLAGLDPDDTGELFNIEFRTEEEGVLRGTYRPDKRIGHLEQIEPTHALVKIVDKIVFVWVPEYLGCPMRPHWLSTSGHRVRVFEPKDPESSWQVTIHEQNLHNPPQSSIDDIINTVDESTAFQYAISWVRNGTNKRPR